MKHILRKAASIILTGALLAVSATPLLASDHIEQGLSLDEAKAMALRNSKSYQQAKYDIDRAWVIRDDAKDNMSFEPQMPNDPFIAASFTNLLTADMRWQMSKKELQSVEDAIEVETVNLYMSVLQAEKAVKTAQKSFEAADWRMRATRAGYQVGTVSKSNLVSAEATVAEARAGLESARQNLTNAYEKFNTHLGINQHNRPNLTYKPQFEPIRSDNVDHEVAKALATSPALIQAQYQHDILKATRNAARPFNTGQIDINKANLAIGQVREGTDKAVRNLFYNIKALEEQYTGLTEALRRAEEELRVAQVMYEVGMITRTDFVSAEAVALRAEKNLFDLLCNHETLKKQFQKPWASRVGA
ncbi:TolC family protein [Heliorestis acidaminivorans]|uniref:TolC family protein n=1 Tax=Heliorestis acidaminivorans TaxID=553427 RepID=A0A6I0F4L8_9FIRM|nr:TolC family protein [Heliorestis acidaminivorans]KAB2953782.1 TolC family protein [Heliorestis acidaminivorans]